MESITTVGFPYYNLHPVVRAPLPIFQSAFDGYPVYRLLRRRVGVCQEPITSLYDLPLVFVVWGALRRQSGS